jgi:hypothetical protein
VLASGYQTKSKNFMEVMWVAPNQMKNVKKVPDKGYILKRQAEPNGVCRESVRSRYVFATLASFQDGQMHQSTGPLRLTKWCKITPVYPTCVRLRALGILACARRTM